MQPRRLSSTNVFLSKEWWLKLGPQFLRSACSICLYNMSYCLYCAEEDSNLRREGGEEKGIVQLQSFQNGLNWDVGWVIFSVKVRDYVAKKENVCMLLIFSAVHSPSSKSVLKFAILFLSGENIAWNELTGHKGFCGFSFQRLWRSAGRILSSLL